jgi:hypothetical protein
LFTIDFAGALAAPACDRQIVTPHGKMKLGSALQVVLIAIGMGTENRDGPDRAERRDIKRRRLGLSRPRIIMGLLLIIAIPIFISLANKAVRENAEAIRQGFGR